MPATATTVPSHRCPFCDAPTDLLMCWTCGNGEQARGRSVYYVDTKPHRRGTRTPTPTRPTHRTDTRVRPAAINRPARTLAEIMTRPYAAQAVRQLVTDPSTDLRDAAAALLRAYARDRIARPDGTDQPVRGWRGSKLPDQQSTRYGIQSVY